MSSRLRAIAQETVAIAERGAYRTACGTEVVIAPRVARAVAGTRLHLPGEIFLAKTCPRPVRSPPRGR